jgi:hypothetical protein
MQLISQALFSSESDSSPQFIVCHSVMTCAQDLTLLINGTNASPSGHPLHEPEFARLVEAGGYELQHELLQRLTKRVISALRSQRAGAAFEEVAVSWGRQNERDLNAMEAAKDFQDLLDDPSHDQRRWAILIVGRAMLPEPGGTHLSITHNNNGVSGFSLDNQYVMLDGFVSAACFVSWSTTDLASKKRL